MEEKETKKEVFERREEHPDISQIGSSKDGKAVTFQTMIDHFDALQERPEDFVNYPNIDDYPTEEPHKSR